MKSVIVFFAFFLIASNAHGQWSIGHESGALFNWQSAEPSWADSGVPQVYSSLQFNIPMRYYLDSSRVSLESGIQLLNKGVSFRFANRISMTALQLPLVFNYQIGKRSWIGIGAAYGQFMGGRMDMAASGISVPIINGPDLTEVFVRDEHELSLLLKMRRTLPVLHDRLQLSTSVQYGLNDISMSAYGSESKYRNVSIGLALGYEMRSSKKERNVQTNKAPSRLSIGSRLGANASLPNYTSTEADVQNRIGGSLIPLAGVEFAMHLQHRMSYRTFLAAELGLVQTGFRAKVYSRETSDRDIIRINYLRLTPLVGLRFNSEKKIGFRFAVGPYLSKALGGRHIWFRAANPSVALPAIESSLVYFGVQANSPFNPRFTEIDYGASAHASIAFQLTGSELLVGVSYSQGFKNVLRDESTGIIGDYGDDARIVQRTASVNIGYLLPWRR